MNTLNYTTLSHERLPALKAVLSQCFSMPFEDDTYYNRVGVPNFRIIEQAGQVAGGLAILPMGQWFGGQRVPMAGIAAVGVAPEYRGAGAAIALLRNLLQELYAAGVPVSALYPATQRLYRKAGYEQGGVRCIWELSTETLQLDRRGTHEAVEIYPLNLANIEALTRLQTQAAQSQNGNLDRHAAIWTGTVNPDAQTKVYGYAFGTPDASQGYVLFTQQSGSQSSVRVRDWVLLTPEAVRRFWKLMADHRSMMRTVRWMSSAVDPLIMALSEQTAEIKECDRWLLRIVNVKAALEKRGYQPALETELHLHITDDIIPENNGAFVLSVAHGKGTVTPGGQGDLRLDVSALASLYSGLFSATQLQQLGYLDAPESARAIANQIFSDGQPWMPDFF